MKEQFELRDVSVSKGAIKVVVDMGKEVVGRAALIQVGKLALLEDFRVAHDARNQGVGTKLLQEVERKAKENGVVVVARIGMFCDEDSVAKYVKDVRFLVSRGYKYFGIYLAKKL